MAYFLERKCSGDIMKKVIMLLSNPFKPDPRVYKEARSLVNHGYDVTVLAWDREGKYPKKEVIDGIKIERIRLKSRYGLSVELFFKMYLFWALAFFKSFKDDFDVIHTHDFDTAILGLLFKLLRKKWIYDVHDLYFTFFSKENGKNILMTEIVRKMDLFFAKICDIFIVPTESIGGNYKGLKEFYIDYGILKNKIITIWNVPDIDKFLNQKKLNLKKSDKFTIGFIGAQRTIQNFVTLFEAVKKLGSENYKILFVGEGKDTEKLKKIAKEKYSDLEIEFVGFIDYKMISDYYKVCDCIFSYFPPARENVKRGISIKVFESSILGLPTIVNRNSLSNDFVEKYNCGIGISNLDVNEFMAALKQVRNIFVNNKDIQKTWNWKIMERRLLNTYKEVLR